jgi:thioredoxin 1
MRAMMSELSMTRPAIFASQSYSEALSSTTLSGKLLVVDATAAWCQPCKTMDRVTWADTKVVAWLEAHAMAVQIDVDEEKQLAASLAVRSMPTLIAFRSGKEVDRAIGMKGPGELIAWLEAVERGETGLDQLRRAVGASAGDMDARLAYARGLAAARHLAEATEEYAWLWEHVLEHQPAMVGVRGSYMLTEIAKLIADSPQTRERFAALRDEIGTDGAPTTATSRQVTEWLDLSLTLGDDEMVSRWFDANVELIEVRAENDAALRTRLVRFLTARGRWADASRLFREPLAILRARHERLEVVRGHDAASATDDMRPRMIASLEGLLRRDAAVMFASLRVAGRDAEARAVVDEVKRLCPGADTEAVLAETARVAGVAAP